VTDSATARVLALKALKQGPMRRAFNLENGLGYSVREVIAQAGRVTGRASRTGETRGRRPGGPARLMSN
jgi:UDP-glucose 4-epimerase